MRNDGGDMRHGTMTAILGLLLTTACAREDGTAAPADRTGTNMTTGVQTASEAGEPPAPTPASDPATAPAAGGPGDDAAARQAAEGARAFFLGTWTGPEGLSFEVARKRDGDGYRIRNRDTLDTEQRFDARREGGTLRFVRRGAALTARPGTGAETGFKWLANKRDCLIVQPGIEGYCRD